MLRYADELGHSLDITAGYGGNIEVQSRGFSMQKKSAFFPHPMYNEYVYLILKKHNMY